MPRRGMLRALMLLCGVVLAGLTLQYTASLRLMLRERIAINNLTSPSLPRGLWNNMLSSDVTPIPSRKGVKELPPIKYNVLINSYMNSGSRFTGQLFGFRKDAFYFYEPLWRFSVWDYFHEPDKVCSSLKGAGDCKPRTATAVNVVPQRGVPTNRLTLVQNLKGNETVTGMMTDVLQDIYHCNFARIKNLVVNDVHDHRQYAGDGWSEYRTCIRSRHPKEECLRKQEEKCRTASHVVTKVLRLTTQSLSTLMEKNPNLKVIQLFRDPRAIVNSRQESRGYPSRDVTLNAAALCHKMYLDYVGGKQLMEKYPGRFRFIFYDDLKTNVQDKMKELYKFVGMDWDMNELKQLNKVQTNVPNTRTPVTLNKRVSDNANWWRAHLSFPKYQSIMDQCKNRISVFNMTMFKDIYELQRLTTPALTLPEQLTVKVA